MKARLPLRLFVSYAAVVAVGVAVSYVTIRLLAPHLFDQRMGAGYGQSAMRGMGPGAASDSVHSAFVAALDRALLVGAVSSAAAAGVVAALVARRLLRPLDAVRDAARHIAAGNYAARVPVPREPELAALADDVNTLAAALADTEARRTRLLGEVAHEMRTPLTSLDGYVEGLIDGVFTATPETLASLSDELRRLHRLADDLSALSRAEERRIELHPADADLADLARRAAARLQPQFDDAGVTLAVTATDPLPVRVDPDRILQVLTNLLGNALLATPAGGRVDVLARPSGHRMEVAVRDTGVGLSPEDCGRVFERFYRAPGHPRRSPGSGIGLTIARGIARAHGGDVTAGSPGTGQGATFVLSLPPRGAWDD